MERIRVLICNHHPIVRSGLRLLLERAPEIRVVGEASDRREAVMLTEYCRPDVAILDLSLPDTNGISTGRDIVRKAAGTALVFVSDERDEGYVTEAIKAGAHGYVLSESVQTDLVRAIQVVAEGGRFVSAGLEEHASWGS
jgi:DNA-binding NarL/FixJ family response regulator